MDEFINFRVTVVFPFGRSLCSCKIAAVITFKKKISPSNSWLFQSSFPPEIVEMRDTGLQILLFPSKVTLFPAK